MHHGAGRPLPAALAIPDGIGVGARLLLQPAVPAHEQRRLLLPLRSFGSALLPPIAQFGGEDGRPKEVRRGLLRFGIGICAACCGRIAKGEEPGACAVLVFGIAPLEAGVGVAAGVAVTAIGGVMDIAVGVGGGRLCALSASHGKLPISGRTCEYWGSTLCARFRLPRHASRSQNEQDENNNNN